LTLIQTVKVKFSLATRGKWISEHDVSQNIYIYLQKWSFKILYRCQCIISYMFLSNCIC